MRVTYCDKCGRILTNSTNPVGHYRLKLSPSVNISQDHLIEGVRPTYDLCHICASQVTHFLTPDYEQIKEINME